MSHNASTLLYVIEDEWEQEGLQMQTRVNIFLSSNLKVKEKFAITVGKRKLYDELTMTAMLLLLEPWVLGLEEYWIDLLLEAEYNIKLQ